VSIMKKYSHPLKAAALVLAAISYVVAKELERRELDEAVDRALDRRENTSAE
jgi:hypothetical protein